jgi:protein TonB
MVERSLSLMSTKMTLFAFLPMVAWIAFGQDAPKKVTLLEANAAITSKVSPEYPAIGRQLRIEGKVELEAVISENGTVDKVNIVSGNAILTRPAVDAVKKWKFAPFQDGGKPCKALAPLIITFKL